MSGHTPGDRLDLDAIVQRSLRVAESAPVRYEWHAQSDIATLLEVDVPALHQEVRRVRAELARLRARYDLCGECAARAQAAEYGEPI